MVDKFNPYGVFEKYDVLMKKEFHGHFVLYGDYKKLEKENAELKLKIDILKIKLEGK